MDSPHSVLSMNSDHGGHESDFRQADVSAPAADTQGLIQVLLETLASARRDPELAQSINQALAFGTEEIEEDMRQKYAYESIAAQDRDDHNTDPHTAQAEHVTFKDPQSPALLEADLLCLPCPVEVGLQLPPTEAALKHTLPFQVSETAKKLSVKSTIFINIMSLKKRTFYLFYRGKHRYVLTFL